MSTPQHDALAEPIPFLPRPPSVLEPTHQPRDRAVPCRGCRTATANQHAVCASCHTGNGWQHGGGTCTRCENDPTLVIWPPVLHAGSWGDLAMLLGGAR